MNNKVIPFSDRMITIDPWAIAYFLDTLLSKCPQISLGDITYTAGCILHHSDMEHASLAAKKENHKFADVIYGMKKGDSDE